MKTGIEKLLLTLIFVLIGIELLVGSNRTADPSTRQTWKSKNQNGQWRYGNGYLAKEDWKMVSTNRADWGDFKAIQAFDKDLNTYWYQQGALEHEMVIDLGESQVVAALSVLTVDRPADKIKSVELFLADVPEAKGNPIAKGVMIEEGFERYIEFNPARGRYLILRIPVESIKQRVCISELNLVSAKSFATFTEEKANIEKEELLKKQLRTKAWMERSNPENIQSLAGDFMSLLALKEMTDRISPLRHRKEMVEVHQLANQGKNIEALTVFRDYFINKLRTPNYYGLTTHDVSPYSKGTAGLGWWNDTLAPKADRGEVIASAEKLMSGEMMLDKKWTKIGEPGEVDWLQPIQRKDLWDPNMSAHKELFNGSGFHPLVHAWLLTHDKKYLDRWFTYMDDWSMNSEYIDSIHPCFAPMDVHANAIPILRLLGGIATVAPKPEFIPADTMARILKKLIRDSLLKVVYLRSNTHNWTPTANLILVALILDEFKAAPVLFRECRRRNIEDNAVTQNLRDGTENQQDPWYNDNYLQVAVFQRLMDARQNLPLWMEQPWIEEMRTDLAWRQEMDEHLNARINYYLHMRTPQNEWPIGIRGGDKRKATGTGAEFHYGNLYSLGKDAYSDPENRRIVANIQNPESGVRPTYTSEWFPYAGYNLVREGWERDDGYGFLFCSPVPGGYGAFRSQKNNNTFGLGGFGQDLLVNDCVGHYMHPGSPIKVDRLNQFFHAGYYMVPNPARHKKWMVSAWTEPSPWRWHASDSFNLMEGEYKGSWDDGYAMKPVKECLTGPEHHRQVHYVREAGVWIITDRMQAGGTERSYDQVWRLPISPSNDLTFDRDDIVVNEAERRIFTKSNAIIKLQNKEIPKANISLQQFSHQNLIYTEKIIEKDKENNYQPYGRKEINVNWKAGGVSQVITTVYPRKDMSLDLVNLKSLTGKGDTYGFECETPDGTRIQYLASAGKNAMITLGPVSVQGESLLLTSAPGATAFRGLALGCSSITINDKAINLSHSDIELPTLTPIFRPISPVKILPERNVFVDKIELTMQSTTPQVEIRYTLDGSEPTPQSTFYQGPFELTHSAVVKARAYRPGVTQNPVQLSGTHATVVTRTVFDKSTLQESLGSAGKNAGLSYKYYEGDWKDLWLFRDTIKPVKEGMATDLFDLSIIPDTNSPIGAAPAPRNKTFAIEYTGFLEIPEDGVYTLHAPREFVYPDTDAGYELQVYLGREEIPWNYGTKLIGHKQWYPATRLHALGNWSVALKKGKHPFKLVYLDYRTTAPMRLNVTDCREYIWSGGTPSLTLSAPGIKQQPIPTSWFKFK